MKVIIAGAGIGGLAAALALHQRGIQVQVFESVQEIRPLGVGVNVLPHATRALDELGILDTLKQVSVSCDQLSYFTARGEQVWAEPRGERAGYRWPQLSIHRGQLQVKLLEAVRDRLGPSSVALGHRFASARQLPGGKVEARFVDRAGQPIPQAATADLLIGADGINSTVRAQLHPGEGEPKWNGILMCRSTSRARAFLSGRTYMAVAAPDRVFAAYPISEPDAGGLSEINWIAQYKAFEGSLPPPEDWNREIDKAEFLPRFEGWTGGGVDIPALIECADKVFVFPMIDREPIESWTRGRITLLGDAAHPMVPNGSNGASQAILDALALRDALAESGAIEAALERYENARRTRTSQIVRTNRNFGLARVLQIWESLAGDAVRRDAEIGALMQGYAKLAGFDLESVNGAASK